MAAVLIALLQIEQPIAGGAIDVGHPIRTATRAFETGPVSFAGSVLTDAFAPMAVHVYVVQEGTP